MSFDQSTTFRAASAAQVQDLLGALQRDPPTEAELQYIDANSSLIGPHQCPPGPFDLRLAAKGLTEQAEAPSVPVASSKKRAATLEFTGDDFKQAALFIERLTGESYETARCWFQTFDDDRDRRDGKLARAMHGTLTEVWREIQKLQRRGAGAYITVNSSNGGRKATDATGIRCVYRDVDTGTAPDLPLAEHMRVITPGGFHSYLLVNAGPEVFGEWSAVMQRMVAEYGADKKAVDLTRVLRLPGTWHLKDASNPRKIRIDFTSDQEPYTWSEIRAAIPPLYEVPSNPSTGKPTPAERAFERSIALNEVTEKTLHELGCALAVIPSDAREVWITIGHAMASLKGGDFEAEAHDLWIDWSQKSAAFNDGDESQWDTFKTTNITYKSVFAAADKVDRGWRARSEDAWAREHGGVCLDDFYMHGPDNKFIYRPTGMMWPAPAVDNMIHPWPLGDNGKAMTPSKWLARHRAVVQQTWLPGAPELMVGQVCLEGGLVSHPGARVFNRYKAPPQFEGDASQATPWLDHLCKVYPDDWRHILLWFAHRVRFPGQKVNHALVLGGGPGIGKDTVLEPVKAGVGISNVQSISPSTLLGTFTGFLAGVLLVVNEARDLGDVDRFKMHDHCKTLTAAPPAALRVNMKHTTEFYVPNVIGVVFTTNHRTSSLYLPADDRRHYVTWSPALASDFDAAYFTRLYEWYDAGGIGHVLAYLRSVDLSGFDPKAPPRKTPAFWALVAAGESPESNELRSVIEGLGEPNALTIADLVTGATQQKRHDLADELRDRKARTRLPHMLDRVGYASVCNPDNKSGRFGQLFVYAKSELTFAEQVRAARRLEAAPTARQQESDVNGSAHAPDFT